MEETAHFPCTNCGACCANGGADDYIRAAGWVDPWGRCKQWDPETKKCKIYEERPWFCRIDERFTKEGWPEILAYCDSIHQRFYGCPREQEGECPHSLHKQE